METWFKSLNKGMVVVGGGVVVEGGGGVGVGGGGVGGGGGGGWGWGGRGWGGKGWGWCGGGGGGGGVFIQIWMMNHPAELDFGGHLCSLCCPLDQTALSFLNETLPLVINCFISVCEAEGISSWELSFGVVQSHNVVRRVHPAGVGRKLVKHHHPQTQLPVAVN